jgi:hypothetical protein
MLNEAVVVMLCCLVITLAFLAISRLQAVYAATPVPAPVIITLDEDNQFTSLNDIRARQDINQQHSSILEVNL